MVGNFIPLRMGRVRVIISCQKVILGQNVAVLALGPSPTGHFSDKKFFEINLFAIDALKKFQPILFCQS